MQLDELLTHTAHDYLDDRTDLVDGNPDQLWADSTLVRFYNEAQRILCRRAWVIIDLGHPIAGTITLVTNQALYPLHKSVLRVYDATPTDQDWPLAHYDDVALRTPRPFTDDDFFDINTVTAAAPGRPLGFSTDPAARFMRVFRTPSVTENGLSLLLKVARLPVNLLVLGQNKDSPEVPEEYHLWLSDYAAGRCLTMPNVDSANKGDGKDLLAGFEAHVKEARQDRQRAEMNPARWAFSSTTSVIR